MIFMRVKFENITNKVNYDIKKIEKKFIEVAYKFKMNFTFFSIQLKSKIF